MQPVAPEALSHIPAVPQKPLVGNTVDIIRDPSGLHRSYAAKMGHVYRVTFLNEWRISLDGADALEYILMDPDRLFSSEHGWDSLKDLFTGGLLLRDFDDHRGHRRIMQTAFRKPAMDSYLSMMAPSLGEAVAAWPTGTRLKFYPLIKDLTLRLGAQVLMGLPVDAPETRHLNKGFIEEIDASLALVRKPLPFTRYRRGLKARERLRARFADMIAARRESSGEDFFSQMCRAVDEEGKGWSDAEIVDHFNLLMMAAHDTTASALTAMVWLLAEHPEWQDRLAREVAELGDGPFGPDMLDRMPLTEMVFKEALRLIPPVPLVPRRAVRDFEWQGVTIPAGASVTAMIGPILMSPEYFTNPESFDPERFSPNRAEDKSHKFAWSPFGGGAHKCIGMHFASMQVKAFMHAFLGRYRVRLASAKPVDWIRLPIPKPKGGLPLILSER